MRKMKRVVVESPFAGEVEKNIEYGKACIKDCFDRGEAPFASHLIYTRRGVLDDTIPEQRALGIQAGLEWGDFGELRAFYIDLGFSVGMGYGIKRAIEINQPIDIRTIPDWREELYRTTQGWTLIEGLKDADEQKVQELLNKYREEGE